MTQSNTQNDTENEDNEANTISLSFQKMYDLVARLDACHALIQQDFEEILDDLAGTKLEDGDELRAFREAFHAVADRLCVRPLHTDGTPARLQVRTYNTGRQNKAWLTMSSSKKNRSCGAPANTIPKLTLG